MQLTSQYLYKLYYELFQELLFLLTADDILVGILRKNNQLQVIVMNRMRSQLKIYTLLQHKKKGITKALYNALVIPIINFLYGEKSIAFRDAAENAYTIDIPVLDHSTSFHINEHWISYKSQLPAIFQCKIAFAVLRLF